MDTVFALQIAVGVLATFYLHGDGLDACLITILQVSNRHFIVVSFRPTLVHTHEHLCPVLCLGASGSRIDLEHGIHGIFLLAKHVLEF